MKTREETMMNEFETKIAHMYDDLDMPLIPRMFLFGSIMELKGAILESYVLGRVSNEDMKHVIERTADLMGIICDACIAPSIASGVYLSDADVAAEFREIRALRTRIEKPAPVDSEPSVH